MTLSKPPKGDEGSLLLGGFEVVPCDTLTRLSETVVNGVNADRDLRCPESQYITLHLYRLDVR